MNFKVHKYIYIVWVVGWGCCIHLDAAPLQSSTLSPHQSQGDPSIALMSGTELSREQANVVYPMNTYEGRNDDITQLMVLFSSKYMGREDRVDISEGEHVVGDFGIGGMANDFLRRHRFFQSKNHEIQSVGFERRESLAKFHVLMKMDRLPNEIASEIQSALNSDWHDHAGNQLVEIRLVGTENGREEEAFISEVLVGVNLDPLWYFTISVSPYVRFRMNLESDPGVEWRHPELFQRLLEVVDMDELQSALQEGKTEGEMFRVEYEPISSALSDWDNASLVESSLLGADELRFSYLSSSHVTIHMNDQERGIHLERVHLALKEGGLFFEKNVTIRVRNRMYGSNTEAIAQINVWRREGGELVYLGSVFSENGRLSLKSDEFQKLTLASAHRRQPITFLFDRVGNFQTSTDLTSLSKRLVRTVSGSIDIKPFVQSA